MNYFRGKVGLSNLFGIINQPCNGGGMVSKGFRAPFLSSYS